VAKVEDVTAGDCREKCIQEIVFLLVKLCVMDAEDFVELGRRPVHLRRVEVINHNGA
jgi:hypothetical protein